MPVSALPSRYGIGTIGKEAFNFIDYLVSCGQRYWQILPVGPTGFGDSPYQSFSAYAGNPYMIGLEELAEWGLLTSGEIEESGFFEGPDFIDYGDLYNKRFKLLEKAVARLSPLDTDFLAFRAGNGEWLDDYALFMALKSEHNMESFHCWPDKYRIYSEGMAEEAAAQYKEDIHYWSALQYLFYRQWDDLKKYAGGRGIGIIGDIPIYVSPDSSDLWANHKLFQVDKNRDMSFVAGCPPDYFNEDGQLWGNPLYKWNYHREQGYEWWVKRVKHAEKIFDVVRIDHFRGFAGYYSIPAGSDTAKNGQWKRGPGRKFISKIKEEAPDLKIIAEDLGHMTPDVKSLLKFSGFPGMKVLQFAFSSTYDNGYLPHMHIENSVVYTGTHDNTTLCDWVKTALPEEIEFAMEYLKVGKEAELAEVVIKAAMESVSDLCVIPIQDWLGQGKEARVNTPALPEGNWRFRVRKGALSETLAKKILKMTRDCNRCVV